MGLQIVTGYTGTAHIKSAHDRARNAGTVGTGSYVMRTGNMLAAKMQSANTLRIVDGDLMMQGVHATVEAGTHEDLTVDNGTQGKKRNDLVVARYERLAGEPKTESVTLRVIKGEPSDGAAADPAHTEGDILGGDLVAEMPLYRVPIDGITPGEPVALFETVPTIAELRDSVSQDTGVIVLAGNKPGTYDTNGVRYIVRHGICYLSVCCGGAWNVGSIGTTAKRIAILPEGARPVMPVECWSRKPGGGDTTMYVQADGKVMALSSSSTTYFRGYAVFPVA